LRLHEYIPEFSGSLFYGVPSKSTENGKNIFLPSDLFLIGHDFLGHALYKGPKFLFTIWTSWVSKDAEFYVDFKNINLAL
jgi:hypothetical protein